MRVTNEANTKLQETLIQKEQQERLALASTAPEILSRLNVSIEHLPQRSRQLLDQLCRAQAAAQVEQLQLDGLALCHSKEMVDRMDEEYEILKLQQKEIELQAKIDRNARIIEQLRQDLSQSRCSLNKRNPNPENVEDYCRQMRLKVASYEENCKRFKAKYTTLAVPGTLLPSSLASLARSLDQLNSEASTLRQRAEDVQLARQARDTLRQLRK